MNTQEVINELRERVAQLEAARPRRRVFNQMEAALQLNMSVSKFRQEVRAGRIKGTRTGRVWAFRDDALDEYLAALSPA